MTSLTSRGQGGKVWLDETDMAEAYETRVRSLRRLIRTYDHELARLDASRPPSGPCGRRGGEAG